MKIIRIILIVIGCICIIPLALVIWIPVVAGVILAEILHFEGIQDLFMFVGMIAIAFVAEMIWIKYALVPLGILIGL